MSYIGRRTSELIQMGKKSRESGGVTAAVLCIFQFGRDYYRIVFMIAVLFERWIPARVAGWHWNSPSFMCSFTSFCRAVCYTYCREITWFQIKQGRLGTKAFTSKRNRKEVALGKLLQIGNYFLKYSFTKNIRTS